MRVIWLICCIKLFIEFIVPVPQPGISQIKELEQLRPITLPDQRLYLQIIRWPPLLHQFTPFHGILILLNVLRSVQDFSLCFFNRFSFQKVNHIPLNDVPALAFFSLPNNCGLGIGSMLAAISHLDIIFLFTPFKIILNFDPAGFIVIDQCTTDK